MNKYIVGLILFLTCSGCYKEVAIPVKPDFEFVVKAANYAVPVVLDLKNNSTGADSYTWTIEGGDPTSSKLKNPTEIIFKKAGTYTVKLEARSADGQLQSIEKKITIHDQ